MSFWSNEHSLTAGSVNGGNSKELAGQADVDGFLVGGASLKVILFTHCFGCVWFQITLTFKQLTFVLLCD